MPAAKSVVFGNEVAGAATHGKARERPGETLRFYGLAQVENWIAARQQRIGIIVRVCEEELRKARLQEQTFAQSHLRGIDFKKLQLYRADLWNAEAMLRSGRQEPPLQQPASPLPPASAPQYDQYDQREPNVVVVGHGPDRPNAGDAYYDGAAPYAVPYLVPVPYPVLVRAQRSHRGVRQMDVPLTPGLLTPNSIPPSRHDISASPATGIFFVTPARGIFFDR